MHLSAQKPNLVWLIIAVLISFVLSSYSKAGSSWQSSHKGDIDGNGKDDMIVYELREDKPDYHGLLKITSDSGKVLWEHEFIMTRHDLIDDLLFQLDNISVEKWVSSFFNKSQLYGAELEKIKLKRTDLEDDFIEFYATRKSLKKDQLITMILSEKVNVVFSYRASWREELIMIVYVPSLNEFIGYSNGEY